MSALTPNFPESLRAVPTYQLQLPSRIANALSRANILTVGDLADACQQDLTQIRGVGVNAVAEVQQALTTVAACLGSDETIDWSQYYTIMGFEPPIADLTPIAESAAPLLPDDILPLSIGQLHLAPKSYNALIRADITTLRDVLNAFERRFRGVDGFGTTSIELLTQRLQGLADAVAADGTLDWFAFWENQRIMIVPRAFQPGASAGEIITRLLQSQAGVASGGRMEASGRG